MTSFAKFVAVFSAGLLTMGAMVVKGADDKPKKSDSKESGDKKAKKEKKKSEEDKAIDVPMPEGKDAKGLKIPYRDENGKLQMRFTIGVARRIDESHVEMSQLQVETFDEAGEPEMTIDLPTSVLDLKTSVLTTNQAVKIQRDDFEITGNTMIFNTKTKQGGLGGKVRMLIYDLADQTAETPAIPEPKTK
jgi:hypothetical protein